MTTVRYFIPEDGDIEAQPNVFLAPKPRQPGYPPTLAEVKSSFPLPGRYHFRFKSPLIPGSDREKGAMPVWMDCVDDQRPVPTWKNSIIAKITRVGVDEEEDDDDDDEDFRRPVSSTTATPAATPQPSLAPAQAGTKPQPPPPQMPQQQASFDLFDGPSHLHHAVSGAPHSGGLFDQPHHHNVGGVGTTHSHDNLLDMNAPIYGGAGLPAQSHQHAPAVGQSTANQHLQGPGQQQTHQNTHNDFFGMPTPGYSQQQQQQQSAPMSGPFF